MRHPLRTVRPRRSPWQIAVAILAGVVVSGCHSAPPCERRCVVSGELGSRFQQPLGPVAPCGETLIPPGVLIDDGVSEDEAVALALWNNAAYQELLAQLGISRAQVIEAGLLTDPQLTLLFPVGPKQLEFTLAVALEALWLRPVRQRAAELDLRRVAQQMVQNGLNVIRDARVAHADLLLAQRQAQLADETQRLQGDIAGFAERRLAAGEVSELEVNTARITAVQARAAAGRAAQDVALAEARLRTVTGLALHDCPLTAVESPPPCVVPCSPEVLVHEALAFRPDLRAAELAIKAAGERAGLQRRAVVQIAGLLDANERGEDGFEIGPGVQMTLPIFNGNRGQIALADANLQQAMRAYVTVRDQIALDVRAAYAQAVQAEQNLRVVREELLPQVAQAEALARRNYEEGETPYFFVLQTTGQFLTARAQELTLEAALRRANAELERSVGHRLLAAPQELPPALAVPPAPGAANGMELGTFVPPLPAAVDAPSGVVPAAAAVPAETASSNDARPVSYFPYYPPGTRP